MFSCLRNSDQNAKDLQILERAQGKEFSWLSDRDVKRSVR